jgi:hypothetical protein
MDKAKLRRMLQGVQEFIRLAILTAILLFAEWFSAEVQTLIAGVNDEAILSSI